MLFRSLAGLEVYLSAPAEQDTSASPSWQELTGYEVVDDVAGNIGRIELVEEFPMQFIATVTQDGRQVLFPLNETIVLSIDPEHQRLTVRLPDGLLDIYS